MVIGISLIALRFPEQTVNRTKDEARESLAKAIKLILEDRREDAFRGLPPQAIRELVMVK
jgi:predicted RNase H-like HicB family nuclease